MSASFGFYSPRGSRCYFTYQERAQLLPTSGCLGGYCYVSCWVDGEKGPVCACRVLLNNHVGSPLSWDPILKTFTREFT